MTTITAAGFRTIVRRSKGGQRVEPQLDPQLKPLPVWYFAFEGVLGAAYDLTKADSRLTPVVIGVAAVNAVISFTVLGKRRKLVKSMLKNQRTRAIAIGLLALRFGVHILFGLMGTAVSGATGHFALATLMAFSTVAMLWFDQRVSFRALGLSTQR
jgi:hypothetical protein